MTDLNLFSDPTPPAAVAGAGSADAPASEHGSDRRETSASPRTSRGGAMACAKPSPGRRPGRRDASASPTATAGVAAGAGEPSSVYLLGLLDELVVGLRSLGGERLEERLGLVGRCDARLAGVRAETVAALAERVGEAGAAEVLRGDLKQSRGGAKREVQFAGRLADLPGTAEALAAGTITPQHARAIADAAAHTPVDEAVLLAAAEKEPADVFGHTVRDHVNERSAGEDLEERRRRQRAQREANIKRQSDGMYKLFGTFDPVAGARIELALAAMANKVWHAEDARNRATPAQRYADALEALITRQGAGKPQRATLVIVADYDLVAGQLRDARLIDGTPLAPSELLQLALDADILPALFDTKGQPLWLGHKYRHANTAQRIALAVRDGGCAVCGCLQQLLPSPPRHLVGERRAHRHRQSLPALQRLPPQADPRTRRPTHPRPRRQIQPRTPTQPTTAHRPQRQSPHEQTRPVGPPNQHCRSVRHRQSTPPTLTPAPPNQQRRSVRHRQSTPPTLTTAPHQPPTAEAGTPGDGAGAISPDAPPTATGGPAGHPSPAPTSRRPSNPELRLRQALAGRPARTVRNAAAPERQDRRTSEQRIFVLTRSQFASGPSDKLQSCNYT